MTGKDPYDGMSAGRVISYKLSHKDSQIPVLEDLESLDDPIVQELTLLAKKCTVFDRKSRPSATDAVLALAGINESIHAKQTKTEKKLN